MLSRNYQKLLGLILTLCLCFALAVPAFAAEADPQDNQVRMIDVENDLRAYLAEYQPDIEFGSQEFIEYAVDVLEVDGDYNLVKYDNYSNIRCYLSEYLAQFDKAQSMANSCEAAFELSDEEKFKTLTDIKVEIENEIQQEQALYETRESVMPYYNYNASAAAAYATKYAERLAENFPTYDKDCTNFVSQAVNAGGISMSIPASHTNGILSTTTYWYCLKPSIPVNHWHESSSWVGVADFYSYAVYRAGATSISCNTVTELQNKAIIGDVVQLRDSNGKWYHSVIITSGTKGNYNYCAHSNNRDNKPVSYLSGNNAYRIIRF